MIPSLSEISDGMTGAWRLALRDPDALDSFDLSADGFLKSFFALVLTLPLWFWQGLSNRAFQVQILTDAGKLEELPPQGLYFAVEGLGYYSAWLLFLFLMAYMARLLDASDRYVSYVVAYNWASLLAYFLLAMPIVALSNLGLIDVASRFPLSILTLIIQMYFFWYVACRALRVDGLQAGAIVAFELMLVLFIAQAVTSVLYS